MTKWRVKEVCLHDNSRQVRRDLDERRERGQEEEEEEKKEEVKRSEEGRRVGGGRGGLHANLLPAPITSVSGAWQRGRWV